MTAWLALLAFMDLAELPLLLGETGAGMLLEAGVDPRDAAKVESWPAAAEVLTRIYGEDPMELVR